MLKTIFIFRIWIPKLYTIYLQIFIKQTLLMTPGRFLRINTAADQNCYWTLSGKVPQIQPDNHVRLTLCC